MNDNDIIKGLENWALKDIIVTWCNGKDNNLMPVTVKDILKVINNLKAELERLKSPCEMQIEVSKEIEKSIKAEAVKEFWNELKSRNTMDERIISVASGDNLVKEMEVKQ